MVSQDYIAAVRQILEEICFMVRRHDDGYMLSSKYRRDLDFWEGYDSGLCAVRSYVTDLLRDCEDQKDD